MQSPGWTDEPVTDEGVDRFGREGFAIRAAQLIAQAHSANSSTVFGLTGSWGSGKTSLINLIEHALVGPADPVNGHGPVDQEYAVVWFTPWATHDVSGLFGEFFSSLTTLFPAEGKGKNARRAFATLFRIAAPTASVIPIVGGAVAEAATVAAEALVPEMPWDEAFKEATDHIRDSGKKILVVVDDVDRLQDNELLAVLKLVRLLGRFPGVQYLLAYDHNSLMHTLVNAGVAAGPSSARRYIEKMVQYPIAVPALISAQIDGLVNEQLESVVKRHRPNLQVSLSRVRDLAATMRATLNTPRAIGRYVAQLDYELGMHLDGETDVEDVIVLTLLRTTLPELHAKLPGYQFELVTGNIYKQQHEFNATDEKFQVADLVDGLDHPDQKHARAMLEMLFPKLRSAQAMARRKGVSQPDYFGRYFTMTILDAYDIQDSSLEEAVRAACSGNGQDLVSFLSSGDLALALLAIDKARAAFTQLLHETKLPESKDKLCAQLLKTVVPILDRLGTPGQFSLALRDHTTIWVGADVLSAVSNTADAAPIIEVIDLAPDTQTKVSILLAADSSLTHRHHQWWGPVMTAALPDAQKAFLVHLSEQDQAPEEPTSLIKFFSAASSAGVDLQPLRHAIAAAINSGHFKIDDLASRFIYPQSANGISMNQSLFDVFAPNIHYPWYDQPEQDFPDDVYKWVGRRALAVGRIKRPQVATSACAPNRGTTTP